MTSISTTTFADIIETPFEHRESEQMLESVTHWLNTHKIPYAVIPAETDDTRELTIVIPLKHEGALNAYMLTL